MHLTENPMEISFNNIAECLLAHFPEKATSSVGFRVGPI
jgi:hypothetical protein